MPTTTRIALLQEPLEQARESLLRVATEQGWQFLEGIATEPGEMIFRQGLSLTSWGAKLRVVLLASSPTETQLILARDESFAITDWGRGRRAAEQIFEALGATPA